jgi:hypothetical protein
MWPPTPDRPGGVYQGLSYLKNFWRCHWRKARHQYAVLVVGTRRWVKPGRFVKLVLPVLGRSNRGAILRWLWF